MSLSHSRSRAAAESVDTGVASRTDFAVGGSFEAASRIGIFGSVGHTIATAVEHGAGLVVSGGVSVFFVPAK